MITETGAFASIDLVALHRTGAVTGQRCRRGSPPLELDVPSLQEGQQVHRPHLLPVGLLGHPHPDRRGHRLRAGGGGHPTDPRPGQRLPLLPPGRAPSVALAAVVAATLARRFTRPLVAAVTATGRIASGDLDATVPKTAHEDPEFAQLAESINAMGANLVRARDQERQFLLSVSHELRTPLTSIRGYADAVRRRGHRRPVRARRLVISAEAGRLERLVQDLLDLARLDADRFSLDLQALDCGEVVRQVAEGFRPRAGGTGPRLGDHGSEQGRLWVSADSDRLGQVVANLVENASSFAALRVAVGAGSIRPAGGMGGR